MRSIAGFVATGLAIYLAIVVLMFVSQSRQVYFPVRTLATTPSAVGMAYDDVRFITEDGLQLHGWFVPAPEPRGVLLFFHGNAGNISHRMDSISIFRELGLSVFIIDYRGFGQSEGRPSELGTYLDAHAAWDYLRNERGIETRHIIVFGRSLGASVAAWLAAREPPAAVILESAFTSAPDLAAALLPWLPVRWMLRFEYDTQAAVREINAPLLVIHSRDDEIVPFHHGLAVHQAANEPRVFLEIRGGHNDGFLRSRPQYEQGLREFLDAYL